MSLNLKNAETERLVRELVARTGESVTGAVTEAVRQRLAALDRNASEADASRLSSLEAISRDAAPRWTIPFGARDHAELLYDERGLPA